MSTTKCPSCGCTLEITAVEKNPKKPEAKKLAKKPVAKKKAPKKGK